MNNLTQKEIIEEICKWEKRLAEIRFSHCDFSEEARKNAEKIYGDIKAKIKELRSMLDD